MREASQNVNVARAPLQFAVIEATRPVGKSYALDAAGKLQASARASIHEGFVRPEAAADLNAFNDRIDALRVHEVLTYGTPERAARLVTKGELPNNPGAVARTPEHFAFRPGPGIMFLDHDAGMGLDELLPHLRQACPVLEEAPQFWRQSSSAGLQTTDGRWLSFLDRWHGYVAVSDASCIPEAGKALQVLLWAQGGAFGWVEPSRSGRALERTLLDGSVHQGERLDFMAPVTLGPGLARLDVGPHYLNRDAPPFDLTRIRVTPEQFAAAAANKAAAHAAARPALDQARAAYLERQAPRIATCRAVPLEKAREVLARAVDRLELTGDFVLEMADGGAVTVAEVLADPLRFDEVRIPDPLEPDYRGDKRIAVIYTGGTRPTIFSHAHGGVTYTLWPESDSLGFGQAVAPPPIEDARIVGQPSPSGDVQLNAAQLAHLAPLAVSEDGLALAFAEQVGSLFCWTPGIGWMANAGSVWRADECLQRYTAAKRICRAAAAEADSASEKRRLTSAKTVHAVLDLAQSDPRLIVPADEWDADPLALNTPQGVVDLRNGSLHPRAGQLHTRCTAVAPDMGAGAPVFTKFLDDVFVGDADMIAFVQRMLGYCLTADRREQKLFFWYGSGSNGKSTLIDLVQWLIGSYNQKLAGSVLMSSRNERHPAEIAQLRGLRLACSSELEEGAFFNEPLVKELTGDSTISARFMRTNFFQFAMSHKHLVIGNFKPRLRGGDPAMARRIVLVPFIATFSEDKKDPLMPHKLRAEGPAILAWMIRGALAWQVQGLGTPKAVADASREYMALHDDVQLWRDECCTPVGDTKAGDLYADFRRWKETRGEHAPAATSWFQRLEGLPGIGKRRSNGIRYTGIALRPAADFGASA